MTTTVGDLNLVRDLVTPNQTKTAIARRTTDSELFVVKEFSSKDIDRKKEVEQLCKLEAHDNVLRVIASFDEGEKLYVQLEFCDGGSLHRDIKRQLTEKKPYAESQLAEWSAQIFHGVNYLHEQGIILANITAKTVFLSTSRHLVKVGTLVYQGELACTVEDDVFLLGVLLYQLAELKFPQGITYENILSNRLDWKNREKVSSVNFSVDYVAFVGKLLSARDTRPSVADVMKKESWLRSALANREETIAKAKEEEVAITKLFKNSHRGHRYEWGYTCDNGPDAWSKKYPSGNGRNQSPVDIETAHVRHDVSLGPLVIDYSQCSPTTVQNPGHGFQVNFDPEKTATLSGGPLESTYQLLQYHAHWGQEDDKHGSEHTLDGNYFGGELHFVHFDKGKYGTFAEAVKHDDGLAVVGVFITVGQPSSLSQSSKEFQKLVDMFSFIRYRAHDVMLTPESAPLPRSLMPPSTDRYFTYFGSLTAPPLCECVTWIMLAEPITLTPEHFEQLRQLRRLNCYSPCDHNFRPVQPINGRIVRSSFLQSDPQGSAVSE